MSEEATGQKKPHKTAPVRRRVTWECSGSAKVKILKVLSDFGIRHYETNSGIQALNVPNNVTMHVISVLNGSSGEVKINGSSYSAQDRKTDQKQSVRETVEKDVDVDSGAPPMRMPGGEAHRTRTPKTDTGDPKIK